MPKVTIYLSHRDYPTIQECDQYYDNRSVGILHYLKLGMRIGKILENPMVLDLAKRRGITPERLILNSIKLQINESIRRNSNQLPEKAGL